MDKSLEKLSLAEVMTTMKGDNLKLKEIIRSGIWKGEMGNKILKFYIHALAKQNTFICLSLDGSGEMLVPDGFELNKDSISFPLEIFAEVAGGLVAEYLIPDYELSSDYELANDLKEVSSEKGLFKKEMIKNNLEDIRYLLNVEELRNIQGKYEEKFPKFIEEIKDNINNIKNIDNIDRSNLDYFLEDVIKHKRDNLTGIAILQAISFGEQLTMAKLKSLGVDKKILAKLNQELKPVKKAEIAPYQEELLKLYNKQLAKGKTERCAVRIALDTLYDKFPDIKGSRGTHRNWLHRAVKIK